MGTLLRLFLRRRGHRPAGGVVVAQAAEMQSGAGCPSAAFVALSGAFTAGARGLPRHRRLRGGRVVVRLGCRRNARRNYWWCRRKSPCGFGVVAAVVVAVWPDPVAMSCRSAVAPLGLALPAALGVAGAVGAGKIFNPLVGGGGLLGSSGGRSGTDGNRCARISAARIGGAAVGQALVPFLPAA